MSATMPATIESEDLLGLDQQSDPRRSGPILRLPSPPLSDHDNAREQEGEAHPSLLLSDEAGGRPYQHGCVSARNGSADDDCCDLELVGVDSVCATTDR